MPARIPCILAAPLLLDRAGSPRLPRAQAPTPGAPLRPPPSPWPPVVYFPPPVLHQAAAADRDVRKQVRPAAADDLRRADSHLKAYERAQEMLRDLEAKLVEAKLVQAARVHAA